jgi:Zn-dependent peptidase ImmA (M78 family)
MKGILHRLPAFEAGDPNRFALSIEFLPNLDPGYAAQEEDVCWGRFVLWAGGKNLCEHLDRGEVRRSVEWYLLPFLEWLVSQWDSLFHEQRLPGRVEGAFAWESLARTNRPEFFQKAGGWDERAETEQAAWVERHALRSCRHGGLFPDVVIRRSRHDIEVSWGETPLAGAPSAFRFLHGTGFVRVAPDEITNSLYELLRKVVSALNDEIPGSTRFAELKRQVLKLKDPNRREVRTAILAGLGDRFEAWKQGWERLSGLLNQKWKGASHASRAWFIPPETAELCVSGHCEAAVMFGSASPTLTDRDVWEIATRIIESTQSGPSMEWRSQCIDPAPWRGGSEAWREGYRLAEEWAEHAKLKGTPRGGVDIDQHLRELGVHVHNIDLEDRGVAGLAVMPENGTPRVFVNTKHAKCQYRTGRRFVLAHELCHLLHDREQGAGLAMISGPWAPLELEQRANAFAAALLMPDSLLQSTEVACVGSIRLEELVALAKRINVSPDALAHHLANLEYIDDCNRDELLGLLVNQPTYRRATGRMARGT